MKRGFTLIELLAVIVILAIIALIAVPIIAKIVDNTWVNSYKISADNYIDALNNTIVKKTLDEKQYVIANGTYNISESGDLCISNDCSEVLEILVDGTKPSDGKIVIKNNVVDDYYVFIDGEDIFKAPTTSSSCFNTMDNGDGTLSLVGYSCVEETTDVVIPKYIGGKLITAITNGCFSGRAITSVVIPDSVTLISNSAFTSTKLTSVEIPGSVKTITNGAFSGVSLESIILNEGIEIIDSTAFSSTKLTSVEIPGSVKTITNGAFSGVALESIILNEGIETISNGAFGGNKLTSIVIPNSVKNLTYGAFSSQSTLISVTIKGKKSLSEFTSYSAPFTWATSCNDDLCIKFD